MWHLSAGRLGHERGGEGEGGGLLLQLPPLPPGEERGEEGEGGGEGAGEGGGLPGAPAHHAPHLPLHLAHRHHVVEVRLAPAHQRFTNISSESKQIL